MSIRVGTNAVLMNRFDAAIFECESNKGIGKLKSIRSFFRGVSISKDTAQTFIETHLSKFAKKLDGRLVAYDKELRNSRINPKRRKMEMFARNALNGYIFIRDRYMENNREAELAKLRDLSSDEVFAALKRSGLFEDKTLAKIARSGLDLEGSPYW